ncbi:oligosaccharide flippase family protein [Photobacterium damselae]
MIRGLFFNMLILAANFLIPIIIIPIISKNYQDYYLSYFLFSQSLLSIMMILIDWTFSTTGVKELNNCKSELEQISLFINISLLRITIFIALVLIIFIWVYINEQESILIDCSPILLSAISFAISPIFYLQFKEKIKIYSILNATSKLLFILFTIIITQHNLDFYLIPLLFFLSMVSVPLFYWLKYFLQIRKEYIFERYEIIRLFKTYFPFMLASLSSSTYRVFPVVIGGVFGVGMSSFTAYAVVDRIVRGASSLIQPLSQTILPLILKDGFKKSFFYIYLCFGFLLSVILFCFGRFILEVLIKDQNVITIANDYLYYLSIVPLIISISSYLGNQRLIVYSEINIMNKVLFLISIFSCLYLIVVFFYIKQINSLIYLNIIAESLVLLGFFYGCRTKKINIFR